VPHSIRQNLRAAENAPIPDGDQDLRAVEAAPGAKRQRTDDDGLVCEAKMAMWKNFAFLSSRQDSRLSKKGREVRNIPERFKDEYAKADLDEWRKWAHYDAVAIVLEDVAAKLDNNLLLPLRPVRTDKNEMTRGDRSFDEHPLIAKTRLVCPGYRDPQALEQPLQTDAPTLSAEATAFIYAEAAGNNWRLEQETWVVHS
jgi:hypothetical protein